MGYKLWNRDPEASLFQTFIQCLSKAFIKAFFFFLIGDVKRETNKKALKNPQQGEAPMLSAVIAFAN